MSEIYSREKFLWGFQVSIFDNLKSGQMEKMLVKGANTSYKEFIQLNLELVIHDNCTRNSEVWHLFPHHKGEQEKMTHRSLREILSYSQLYQKQRLSSYNKSKILIALDCKMDSSNQGRNHSLLSLKFFLFPLFLPLCFRGQNTEIPLNIGN